MGGLPSSVCSQPGNWSISSLIIYMLAFQLTWKHFQLILVCWNLCPHYSLCYQHLQHFWSRSNNGTVAIFYEAIIMTLVKLKWRNVIKGRIYAQECNHGHFFPYPDWRIIFLWADRFRNSSCARVRQKRAVCDNNYSLAIKGTFSAGWKRWRLPCHKFLKTLIFSSVVTKLSLFVE